MTALGRKSWKDLQRRPARTTFTIASIAFAVAGLWIFAMPVLMDNAMNHRIAQDRLHDVRLPTQDVVLGASDLATLRDVPGVSTLDTRTIYDTRIVADDRRRDVLLVGVSEWRDQQVNAIPRRSVLHRPSAGRIRRFASGGGERKKLRLIAEYADACNLFATKPDDVAHKLDMLRRHCDDVGREPSNIRKTILYVAPLDPTHTGPFVKEMAEYAQLGIEEVNVMPGGDEPDRWIEELGRNIVPQLAGLGRTA